MIMKMINNVKCFPVKPVTPIVKAPEEMRNLKKLVENVYELEAIKIECMARDLEKFCEESILAYEIEEGVDQLSEKIQDHGYEYFRKQNIIDGRRGLVSSLLSHPVYSRHLEDYVNIDFSKHKIEYSIQLAQVSWLKPSDNADDIYQKYLELLDKLNEELKEGESKK